MTEHFLRLKWMPVDEAELLRAYQSGLLAERNWCDLKSALGSTRGANTELARDLASFAVDGGTLIIGLDEKEPKGSPLTPVSLADVTPERVEQIAAFKADPPLAVKCTQIEASAHDGTGYVLVHVPASPLAPHQVEGKYQGRGDKTKRVLSDAEVAQLVRLRGQNESEFGQILAAVVAGDPFQHDDHRPHLFMVAQPVSRNSELARGLVGVDRYALNLLDFMDAVPSMPGAPTRRLSDLRDVAKTAMGARLRPHNLGQVVETARERYFHELVIHEDGGVRYYNSNVGEPGPAGTVPLRELYLDLVLITCREVLNVLAELSRGTGFAGMWHIGVEVTAILNAQAVSGPLSPGGFRIAPPGDRYTGDDYARVTSASVREIDASPGQVTERLLGRLYRSLSSGTPAAFR